MKFFEDVLNKIRRIEAITFLILQMKKTGNTDLSVSDIQVKAGNKADMASVILDLTKELMSTSGTLREYGKHI